jgi:release factor glutamine methyltransferase
MLTYREALVLGARRLMQNDSRSARSEAEYLLSETTGADRATLRAYPDRPLMQEQEQRYLLFLSRREQHEPLAYIVGHQPFYTLDLLVDRRVLIPRPETELLVETALARITARINAGHTPLVADIGTGSGAIPIALAVEEPRLPLLYACDISSEALAVARANCQRYHVTDRVHLLQGDLLSPIPEPVDILIANLPYVGTEEIPEISLDVLDYEPHLALFSGSQGLDLIVRLLEQAQQRTKVKANAVILLEIGYRQYAMVQEKVKQIYPEAAVSVKKDYAGWDRIVQIEPG